MQPILDHAPEECLTQTARTNATQTDTTPPRATLPRATLPQRTMTEHVAETSAVTAPSPAESKTESLDALMARISNDARTETAFYLLRSNTSHDGE